MEKEIVFVLLDEFADWEAAFLAPALCSGVMPGRPGSYAAKYMSPDGESVRSIGGLRATPDYDASALPESCAGLILVGGMQWESAAARRIAPLAGEALKRGILVGAICNAVSFMAANGLLNGVRHTGNTVEMLKQWGGANYTGEALYEERRRTLSGAAGRARRQRRDGKRHGISRIHPRMPARAQGRHARPDRGIVQVQQIRILQAVMDALEQYIRDHTSPEEELLHELDRETNLRVIQPRMLSGHIQGRLLEMLVRMLRPRRVLEIGTFTGYSALCMAAGLDGIAKHLDPGAESARLFASRTEAEKAAAGIDHLPDTLREAATFMEEDSFVKMVLGQEFVDLYVEAKKAEWNEYMSQVSEWEVDKYLYRT